MQVNNLTIEQFLTALHAETDIDAVKTVAADFAADLKTTKETLIKICEMFGLYQDGKFADNIKTKNVLSAISAAAVEALNPLVRQQQLAEKYSFLANIAIVAKKYQSF